MAAEQSQPGEPNGVLFTRRQALGIAAVVPLLLLAGDRSRDTETTGRAVEPHITLEAREVNGEEDLARSGIWNQAGLQQDAAGLRLRPTGLSIIDKRHGDRIVPNPPLNVYGSRLAVTGDFAVSAHLRSHTPVSVNLYGLVPIRFDDFLHQRGRVECIIDGDRLTVRLWNETQQDPRTIGEWHYVSSVPECQLEVQRIGHELAFRVNGQHLVRISNADPFASGQVWFGLNSEEGEAFVTHLAVRQLNDGKLRLVDTTSLRMTQSLPDGGLQAAAGRKQLTVGTAVTLNPLLSDAQCAEIILGGEVGRITPENALKPQDTQPRPGQFFFEEADALLAIAMRHGIAVHGHTLVYENATPQWMRDLPYDTVADRQRAREILIHHVQTVVRHFRGRIRSWDVINEPVAGFNNDVGFADSIWYRALGPEYIAVALRAAHEADPDADLFINDYGMETNPQGRGEFMLQLVRNLQAEGAPIHGIGIEGHVYQLPRDAIYQDKLRRLIDDFQRLGLHVRISEIDVTGAHGVAAQSEQYAGILQVCLEKGCDFATWGLIDRYGSTAREVNGRLRIGSALPYNANYQPKQARTRMLETLLRE